MFETKSLRRKQWIAFEEIKAGNSLNDPAKTNYNILVKNRISQLPMTFPTKKRIANTAKSSQNNRARIIRLMLSRQISCLRLKVKNEFFSVFKEFSLMLIVQNPITKLYNKLKAFLMEPKKLHYVDRLI